MKLRKIPLEDLLEILQDLYESGVDYIDLDGEQDNEGDSPRDSIRITVKPEYITDLDTPLITVDDKRSLSDDDINELI